MDICKGDSVHVKRGRYKGMCGMVDSVVGTWAYVVFGDGIYAIPLSYLEKASV